MSQHGSSAPGSGPTRRTGPRPDGGQPRSRTRRADQRGRRTRPGGRRAPGGRADAARRAAWEALRAIEDRDAYANLALAAVLRRQDVVGREAALATELCNGVLRGRGAYDAVLGVCSDRDVAALDPAVRAVLRLGTHQLLGMRTGSHAAVSTSVDLVRDVAGPRPSGFVNAVLRRVATRDLDQWVEIVAPRRSEDSIGHLSIRYSHPRWIVSAFADALGETPSGGLRETEEALASDAERPQVTLAAMPGVADTSELADAGASPARWSAFGAYLGEGDPRRVGAVEQRRAGVQDEASQLAALALARAGVRGRDARWLDVCAGPGGKAQLLAGLAALTGARLVAAEPREHRARLVRAALGARRAPAEADSGWSSDTAAVVRADGTRPAWRSGAFDRVIADVPCSGLGALRRRPDIRWRRSERDIAAMAALQRSLLSSALDAARPGGIVAYVTCSPHLAETQAVVADVLAARPGVRVLNAPAVLAEVPDLACGPAGRYAQFWPHRHGTDAIFIALLTRGQPESDS